MKNVRLLLCVVSCAALLAVCSNRYKSVNQEDADIILEIMDFNSKLPLKDVKISVTKGVETNPTYCCTTNVYGITVLNDNNNGNNYYFEEKDHIFPKVRFCNYSEGFKLTYYLKKNTKRSFATYLTGIVYNEENKAIDNVNLQSNTTCTTTNSDGVYGFWVSRAITYPISYSKEGCDAAIIIEAEQDTVSVDVYISGLSVTKDSLKNNGHK